MTYIGKLELELGAQKHHERVTEALQGGKNPLRPYLFKDYGFHFEQDFSSLDQQIKDYTAAGLKVNVLSSTNSMFAPPGTTLSVHPLPSPAPMPTL